MDIAEKLATATVFALVIELLRWLVPRAWKRGGTRNVDE